MREKTQERPERHNKTAEFIARLTPEKAKQLSEILNSRLEIKEFSQAYMGLFKVGEEGFDVFQEYLKTHALPRRLGGQNNANYVISCQDGTDPVVLQVQSLFMPHPTDLSEKLREGSLQQTLTPIWAKQDVGDTKTLVVTELCNGGDLQNNMSQLRASNEHFLKTMLHTYIQMGTVLKAMQKEGVFFPDIKNTNWLVNGNKEKQTLHIADTKSFMPAPDDQFDENLSMNDGYMLLFATTRYLNPPEIDMSADEVPPFSIDKAYAFMLGKNIYQAMTSCTIDYLDGKNNAEQMSFEDPIFQSEEGMALKQMIKNAVQEDPEQRPSVSDMLRTLKFFHSKIALKEMRELNVSVSTPQNKKSVSDSPDSPDSPDKRQDGPSGS